jgi:hypothetical protein
MAYRDSINAVGIGRQKATNDSSTMSNLHPAHPLMQNGKPGASKDDLMERQSFITAYRNEMDGGPKVQTIPQRLRRLRAQRMAKNGSGPVDLDESLDTDDDQFERQSMITAHRESFESTDRNLPKIGRVQRSHQEATDDFNEDDIPEHLKALIKKKIEEAKQEILMKTQSLEQIKEANEEEDLEEEEEPAVLDWEEKTRQAWERLRGGLGLSVETKEEPQNDKVDSKEEPESGKDDSKDREEQAKKCEDPKDDEPAPSDPAKEVVQETSTFDAITNLFQSMSLSSTDNRPLKGILKSPGSEKRVTFGQDEERLFHDNQDENNASPLKTHPNQQQVPPQSFAPYPYMYPPGYPMMAPSSPMGTPLAPSDMQHHPYFPQMMPGPSHSADSLQHAAPPYYYGFPGHYGGYAYPHQPVMLPPGGLPEEKKKKKKKRVFRGHKFLSGVRKGRHSIGGSTFSTSQDSASSVYDGSLSITTAEA